MGRVHMPPSRLPLRAQFHLERETSGYEAGRVTYGAGPLSTTVACEAPDAFPVVASLPPKNSYFSEGEKRRPEMRLALRRLYHRGLFVSLLFFLGYPAGASAEERGAEPRVMSS